VLLSTGPSVDGAARVVAVVPTLDVASPRLARLVRSVEQLDGREQLHLVIVVNTTSRYRTPHRTAPATTVRTTRLDTGLNLGFGGSIVFAAGLLPSAHVWVLQDDLELAPGCLTALLDLLGSRADLGAVSPTVVTPDRIVPQGTAGGMLDDEGRLATLLPRTDVAIDDYRPDEDADFLLSRGMLVRAEAWEAVGGMDPRYYPVNWTDVDLCARLRTGGWTTAVAPTANLTHERSASTPRPLGVATFRRNGELFRARRAGSGQAADVHPDIPRELLGAIAQEASALVFDLVGQADRIGPSIVRSALRRAARRWLERLGRPRLGRPRPARDPEPTG